MPFGISTRQYLRTHQNRCQIVVRDELIIPNTENKIRIYPKQLNITSIAPTKMEKQATWCK